MKEKLSGKEVKRITYKDRKVQLGKDKIFRRIRLR